MFLRVLIALAALTAHLCAAVYGLNGKPAEPLAGAAKIRVLVFARTDCPITQRYAPELQRIAREFERQPVEFWLVFADRAETAENVRRAIQEYGFPGTPVLDPKHELVTRARATVAPEAAVFDEDGRLAYHGRIDDLYVEIGKSRQVAQEHDLEDAIGSVLAHKPVAHPETHAVGCSLADVE